MIIGLVPGMRSLPGFAVPGVAAGRTGLNAYPATMLSLASLARFVPARSLPSGWALRGAVFRADSGAVFCVFGLLRACSLPLAVLRLERSAGCNRAVVFLGR